MDFFDIKERNSRKGTIEIYPDFKVIRSKDLMIRGKSFYSIWDEERGLWSTDEYDVQRLVDKEILEYRNKLAEKFDGTVTAKMMSDFSTNSWNQFRNYMNRLSDNAHQLDTELTFLNTEVKKKDYVSKRLAYPLEKGDYNAWDELVGTLYTEEERSKIEWAIGSIIAGDSKHIQKFVVFYGEAGTGKSTILNIIQRLFEGYYTTFEAKALTSSNNSFSTEVFRSNPLVAIQHEGDLSKIEDNTKLNSIVAHEEMTMNEKYKPSYTAKANCFLFMATNKPVKITDAKSGVIRRLIDVRPSGKKIATKKYFALMSQIEFELGAIASHCLEVYHEMGKNYYSGYTPLDMIFQTDVFFNFVEENYFLFKKQDGITLAQAYEIYKTYCDESLLEFKLPRYKFREELKNYFSNFSDITRTDGRQVRSYYSGFLANKFESNKKVEEESSNWISLDHEISLLDDVCKDYSAQYATRKETPYKKWSEVTTTLKDINTKKLHYLILPENHIVIDFDIKNETGEKSAELNFDAASKWPPTYAEYSKSQAGLHLHYIYVGDATKLSSLYTEGIEVKVTHIGDVGTSSLRRKLSRCNNIPIARINSGLPLKGEKKMIDFDSVKSEKGLRTLIARNLLKEIHPGTKPSIDFIYKILEDAYKSDLKYDVTDLRPRIMSFANNSTNHSDYCLDLFMKMKFKSEEQTEKIEDYNDDFLVFFDIEVFPNLMLVNWKREGEEHEPVHMFNPEPKDIESLLKMKLVGFNNRRYDNHILYARYVGYSIEEIYTLSQRIIGGSRNAMIGEAYNLSYTDVYDFSSIKQSLKKFQIELGLHHQELGLPWDKPVDPEKWYLVADYCDNDIKSLEVVFDDRKEDFVARQILADLSGLTVNDTTQMHTARIIFGNDPKPQSKFVYTDLSEMFPSYKYESGKSEYRGENPGEGGYVYSEPGSYENVVLLDVASMHPTSIDRLNLFGPYTEIFRELVAARISIKHKDFETARQFFAGKLGKYLKDIGQADQLSYALKIIINIVYGLTSAQFDSKFKDPHNKDNIVAKRGALFMIDLKHAVQEKGYTVCHIKTDSIKISNATKEIIDFVFDFGKQYGYNFEHEASYDRFCLVNDSVYIARYKGGKNDGKWVAVGAQFAHPYVFKTLFSKESILFTDLCEMKTVTTALYLDMNEDLGEEHDYHFIGKAGLFCPILPSMGGGLLLREKDGKYNAATGSKGYRWAEAEVVKELEKEKDIDYNYFRKLVDQAKADVAQYVDFEWFISND